MATTSNIIKQKPENQNLTRSRSLGRKPKLPSPSEDGSSSDKKPEKPLPNYLKPTISSRPDPVKLLKKNNNNSLDDNQKILRRRSFDRPSSSLTSPSASSSPRVPKSLNVSPSRSRERPLVPREKPVTAQRSSSFHGTRGVPRGGSTSKSPQVATKKSGLSSSNTYLKSKKKDSEDVITKKGSEKEITLDTTSMSSGREEEEEILKSDVKVSDHDHIEEAKNEKEVQVEVVHVQDDEDNKSCTPTNVASSIGDEDSIAIKKEEEEEEALINEDETKEKIEEAKEEVNNQDNKDEVEEEVKEKIDEDETPKKVDIDMKEVESDHKETIEEDKEQEKEEEEEEEEKEKAKEEEEESGEEKKREVVKGAGKKESPTRAYNDVIASKMQENPRKNKVLALAGAFQTVIDYETAASK